MELVKNGVVADLMQAGTIVKTAFCGPCFGAGDTPANGAFSIRHSTSIAVAGVRNPLFAAVAAIERASIRATDAICPL